jgi:hypothetical protein
LKLCGYIFILSSNDPQPHAHHAFSKLKLYCLALQPTAKKAARKQQRSGKLEPKTKTVPADDDVE